MSDRPLAGGAMSERFEAAPAATPAACSSCTGTSVAFERALEELEAVARDYDQMTVEMRQRNDGLAAEMARGRR